MKKSALCTFFSLGYDKVAELLIQNGADVNIVGQHGSTALTWAAIKGNIISLEMF